MFPITLRNSTIVARIDAHMPVAGSKVHHEGFLFGQVKKYTLKGHGQSLPWHMKG
jgi:hypothetical protein